jgi:hypothetical protein
MDGGEGGSSMAEWAAGTLPGSGHWAPITSGAAVVVWLPGAAGRRVEDGRDDPLRLVDLDVVARVIDQFESGVGEQPGQPARDAGLR